MNTTGLTIGIIVALLGVLSNPKYGRIQNPVTIINGWWGIWISISALGLGGLYVPQDETYYVFGFGFLLFWFGAMLVRTKVRQHIAVNNLTPDYSLDQFMIIANITFLILFSAVTYIARESLSSEVNVRDAALARGQGADPVFGSLRIRNLYGFVAQPGMLLVLCYGLWDFIRHSRVKFLASGTLCSILYSVALFGRFGIYSTIFTAIAAVLIYVPLERVKKNAFKLVPAGLLLFIAPYFAAMQVSNDRVGGQVSVSETVDQFVNYHTTGFVFIDKELSDPGSLMQTERYYGLLTLSAFEDLAALLIRRIYPGYVSSNIEAIEYREEFIEVGNGSGGSIFLNAYYTLVFTLFADGGWFYFIFGFSFLGYIITKMYIRSLNDFTFGKFFVVALLIWAMMGSLFQSLLESKGLWMGLLIAAILKRLGSATKIRSQISPAELTRS